MKTQFQTADLKRAWSTLVGVVPSRSTMPACLNVAIRTDGVDKCILQATDTELSVRLTVPAQIDGDIATLLPAARIQSIIRETSGATVEIVAGRGNTKIICDSADYEVPTEDWSTFPQFVQPTGTGDVLIAADVLHRLFSTVTFAAALEEGRYAMKGISLEVEGKRVTAIATDGKRLAVAEGTSTSDAGTRMHALLPRKACDLAAKMLDGMSEFVKLTVSPSAVAIASDTWELTTRQVEGRFPPYRDVIPKKREATATLNVERFESAVRAASIMADEESCRVAFECGETFTLAAQGATKGKSHIVFKAEAYTGKPVSISFDPKYIVEGMRAAREMGEVIDFALLGPDKPAVFRAGETWLYLVVPLT